MLYVTSVSVKLDKKKAIKITYRVTNTVLASFANYVFFLIYLKHFIEIILFLLILEMKHLMLRKVKGLSRSHSKCMGQRYWNSVVTHS